MTKRVAAVKGQFVASFVAVAGSVRNISRHALGQSGPMRV